MKPSTSGKTSTPKAPGADIIINATPNELRVALIEEGRLAEIYLDVPDKQRTVGSIYLGRVQKVLQGMNAAFVDIGLEQDAFLHFSDVGSAFDEFREFLDGDDDDDEKGETAEAGEKKAPAEQKAGGRKEGPRSAKKEASRAAEQKNEAKQTDARGSNERRSDAGKSEGKRDDGERKAEARPADRSASERKPDTAAAMADSPVESPVPDEAAESSAQTADQLADENGEGRKKRRRGRRGGRRRRKQREGEEELSGDERKDAAPTAAQEEPQRRDDRNRNNRRDRDHRAEQRQRAPESPVEVAPGPRVAPAAAETSPPLLRDRNVKTASPAETAATPAPEASAPRRAAKRGAAAEAAGESAPAVESPAAPTKRRAAKKEVATATDQEAAAAPKRTSRKKSSPPETDSVAHTAAETIVGATPARRSTRSKSASTATTAPESAEAPAPTRRRTTRSKKSEDGDAPVRSGTVASALPTFQTKRSGTITIALERGQDIMVQVTRESYSSKGVRVASKISLPGRFLVLLPLDPGIGISRKVQSEKERRRLRRIARSILPEGHGCIIRTVAEGRDEEVIRQDLTSLVERWKMMEERVRQTEPPALLYRESSIAGSMMRDLLTRDVGRIMIDNREMYDALTDYVAWAAPWMVGNVHLHTGPQPVFEQYGVERELERMMEPKIYTPSGGYIIIDRTEAMTVIDVNSGRFVGKKDQEQNALKTNLEAAREIARQLRLRDVGGLIVVDFIDLDDERNRKKVYDELKREMRNDKAKSVVLPMTQFGIVQMTRQRIRQQVVETLTQPCACCNGTGSLRSRSVAARALERWLERFRAGSRERQLTLRAHHDLVSYLSEGEGVGSRLTEIMRRTGINLVVVPDGALGLDSFHLLSVRNGTDITREFARDKRGNASATPLPPYVLPAGVAPLEESPREERARREERREEQRDGRNRGEQRREEAGTPGTGAPSKKEDRNEGTKRAKPNEQRAPQGARHQKDRRNQQRTPQQTGQPATAASPAPATEAEQSVEQVQQQRHSPRNERRHHPTRRDGRAGRAAEERAEAVPAEQPQPAAAPQPSPMPPEETAKQPAKPRGRATKARNQKDAEPVQAPVEQQPQPEQKTRRGGRKPKEQAPEQPSALVDAQPESPAEAKPKRRASSRAKKGAETPEVPGPSGDASAAPSDEPKQSTTKRAPRKSTRGTKAETPQ